MIKNDAEDEAIPSILSDRHDLRVFIDGDGHLWDSIAASLLQEDGIATRVDLTGWNLPR